MVRFSQIAWVIGIAICMLVFAYTGAPLALAAIVMLVVVPLVGFVLVNFAIRKVGATLTSQSSAEKDATIPCELAIHNASRLPFSRIEVLICVDNLLTAQHSSIRLWASVPGRGEVHVPFELQSALCGRIECRVERITGYEFVGLLHRSHSSDADRRLSVMPTLYNTRMRNTLSAAPLSDTTTFSQFVKGSDASEVFGLRDYEPGDDLRRIHWKLSDKVDGLVVREASLPLDNSLLVFWEKDTGGITVTPQRADAMAEVMLGICQELSSEGIEYEVAFDDVEAARCLREYVADENDIYELIGHIISQPLGHAGCNGLEMYQRLFGALSCTRIIYVGATLPDDIDVIRRGRQVLAFLCDDSDDVSSEPGYAEVHFTQNGAQLAMQRAGVV